MRHRLPLVFGGVVVITIIVALLSGEALAYTVHGTFVDDNGHPLEDGIEAIAKAGITQGCNPPANDRFCPDREMTRAEAAAFISRALDLPDSSRDFFVDDDGHVLEPAINRIAEAGITFGCNAQGDRFCPNRRLSRAESAAFFARALELPNTGADKFTDDDGHLHEDAINRAAAAGITLGCNPPDNTRFCPNDDLTRAQSAGFMRRARDLPIPGILIQLSDRSQASCSRDGERCTVNITLGAGTTYRIREGMFQVLPYGPGEESAFTASDTTFGMTLDGNDQSLSPQGVNASGGKATRYWLETLRFSGGSHTLVGEWRWNGSLVQRVTAHVTATG